ncbi:hypothetical protein [Pyrobaculum aerophilum]|uniref:Uncharacterized protein n=1 Tax=Pyrobaculum aerophilum TaxID=13773 RepID=A0A371R6V5_9CREN|nr:hypothetical protein [Pyrobaculum aerophilum]RFA94327.1 hypothetical protein CGL51_10370 [Pyrobaculum aerophilum]RFB00266.1 hypothetical protein CGL52_01445 [Pyrobaculum aerophilum]
MVPLEKILKLREGGYEVVVRGGEVEIFFTTPTIGDAASNPEAGDERRRIVVRGVVQGEEVKLTDAYVEEEGGAKRRINLRDLELWVEYIKNL